MGLTPLLATLLTAATPLPGPVPPATMCIASDPSDPAFCVGAERQVSPHRLIADASVGPNLKMDAFKVNPRPCRIVGSAECPGKTRTLYRTTNLSFMP